MHVRYLIFYSYLNYFHYINIGVVYLNISFNFLSSLFKPSRIFKKNTETNDNSLFENNYNYEETINSRPQQSFKFEGGEREKDIGNQIKNFKFPSIELLEKEYIKK